MHKLLVFFAYWPGIFGSSQAPPRFPDTPIITRTSVGKVRIGMPVAKLKELYKGYTLSPDYMSRYGFDELTGKPDAMLVSMGKDNLFLYFTGYDVVGDKMIDKNKVAGLLVFHPAYQTAKGIHVGSMSGQLKTALPTVRVGLSPLAPAMQIASSDGLDYIFCNQGHVGKYVVADEPVKIAVATAKISWIQVYPH